MSAGFFFLAFLAVASPPRVRLALAGGRAQWPALAVTLALGAAVAFVVAGGLVAGAGELLDGLRVSPESFRLAAGLVLALEGAQRLVWPRPAAEPELPGRLGAIVPVAFPYLLGPGLVILAIAAGADASRGEALAALGAALALVAVSGFVPPRPLADALLAAGVRLLAGVEIGVAAALGVEAIRDV